MAKQKSIQYGTRDGLTINGHLTLPRGKRFRPPSWDEWSLLGCGSSGIHPVKRRDRYPLSPHKGGTDRSWLRIFSQDLQASADLQDRDEERGPKARNAASCFLWIRCVQRRRVWDEPSEFRRLKLGSISLGIVLGTMLGFGLGYLISFVLGII